MVWYGRRGTVRYGAVRCDEVGLGVTWQAWYVRSRHGLVRFGKAGEVW